MSLKSSSIRAVAKALFALPFVALSMNAVAQSSASNGTDSEKFTYVSDREDLKKVLNDNTHRILFIKYDENDVPSLCVKEPNGTIRPATDNDYENWGKAEYWTDPDKYSDQLLSEGQKKELYGKHPLTPTAPMSERSVDGVVFVIVEKMPEFPGGETALAKYIAENVNYPEDAKGNKEEVKPFVSFVIDSTGNVANLSIARSSGSVALDNEALRVVSKMPKWKPGSQRGVAVNVSYTVPVQLFK